MFKWNSLFFFLKWILLIICKDALLYSAIVLLNHSIVRAKYFKLTKDSSRIPSSISGFSGSNNSVYLGLEPWLSQRFIAGLIWLYRVYRQLREKRQGKNETKSLMKEIYFGFRFDNLYSIFSPMSSARLCRCCVPFFSLLFHNFFSISSTCLQWWCWDKILGEPKPLKWFIAIETWYNTALRPVIKHCSVQSLIKESP